MKKLLKTITLPLLGGTLFFFAAQSNASEVLLFQESFETDGAGTRYQVIAGGDNGAMDLFARRRAGTAGTKAEGGTLDGEWMWAAERIVGAPGPRGPEFPGQDLRNDQGRLIFTGINVAGMGKFRMVMAAATGNGGNEPADDLYIRIRFDGGEWIEIGGFKSSTSNSRPIYYAGPKDTLTTAENPNKLFRFFSDWEWDVFGKGSVMDFDITIASNARDDEIYIDNIRLFASQGVGFFDAAFALSEVVEPVSGGVLTPLTLTLAAPAPEGGVRFHFNGSFETLSSLKLPDDPVLIPAGQTSAVVPVEVIQDGRFTGTKLVDLFVTATGYNPEIARIRVENTTPRPTRLLIMEAMNVVPGTHASHLFGDANGDGRYHNTGDQFIEIVNFEDYPIDLSGWTIGDDLSDRHLIPSGTILYPNTALVVFGGGTPRGVFGGAIVQTATAGGNGLGYNITSRGEFTYIKAPFGEVVDLVSLPLVRADILAVTNDLADGHAGKGVSASVHRLNNESTPLGFAMDTPNIHSIIAGSGQRLFSPGTWIDGNPYFTPENEITLSIADPVISEDAGPNATQGSISLSNPAPAGGLAIRLETNGIIEHGDGTFSAKELDLDSLTIVVPEGLTSTTFRIGAHNDGVLDGDQIVTLMARAGPYVVPGFAEMTVVDVQLNDLDIVINEVLIDVVGTASDFNLDGRFEDILGDQFIEIVNESGRPINMSGWTLTWETGDTWALVNFVHAFPQGTVVPDAGAVVVFGRMDDANANDPIFGGALVQGAREDDGNIKRDGLGLILTNSFFLKLRNEHGFVVNETHIQASMSSQDMSLTRDPDFSGNLALHLDAALLAGGFEFLLASPGRMINGLPFPGSGVVRIFGPFPHIEFTFSSGWFGDPVFGWMASGLSMGVDVPWVYMVDHNDYWYVVWTTTEDGEHHLWYYDRASAAWHYTRYDFYPLVWSAAANEWITALK